MDIKYIFFLLVENSKWTFALLFKDVPPPLKLLKPNTPEEYVYGSV